MKKIFKYGLLILPLFILGACQDDLDVVNPNEPGLQVLDNEEGLTRAMLGTWWAFSSFDYVWIAQAHHEIMGDAIVIPWGNFGWRWANQPSSITLDDGRVWTPPQGGSQQQELVIRNDRAQGDNNAFLAEWLDVYQVNNHCNLLLNKLDEGGIELSGDAENKERTIRAWAHYWKGWAYARIGSLYSAGLITDEFNTTTTNYVSNADIIAESNNQLDLAIDALNSITDDGVYTNLMTRAVPDYTSPDGIPSPDQLVRDINTLKARNILVNTKLADMSGAQWNEILTLTQNGLQQGDVTLEFRTALENAYFNNTVFVPFRILIGWHFPSERLVQDFKAGDQRFDRNFFELDIPEVNIRGRGIQYGTRWGMTAIEQGGDYATTEPGLASLAVAGTWEENHLMRAEALIMTGDVPGGLALIDEVRNAQNAGLDPTDPNLSMEDAYEELRRERRIGLFMRGLPFYDARRWGLTDPIAEGGGRTGCVVLDEDGNLNTNATFDYNYMDYWGVPDNELDFNIPSEGSAPTDPI